MRMRLGVSRLMEASPQESATAFHVLADGLDSLRQSLPQGVVCKFRRSADYVDFELPARTRVHRRLVVSGGPEGMEYELGKIWTENMACDASSVVHVLAACDAVIAGRVREVKDVRTGLLYHIYRLRSRGLNTFARDSEYCLAHYLKLKVRRVRVHSIPALTAA